MQPKFKVGDSVKSKSLFQVMMVITIIVSDDYSGNSSAQKLPFTGKYKCAWIVDGVVFSDYFTECDLMATTYLVNENRK